LSRETQDPKPINNDNCQPEARSSGQLELWFQSQADAADPDEIAPVNLDGTGHLLSI